MHLAYLASRLTLPASPDRRFDAFEHDLMIDCLAPVLAASGGSLTALAWDDTSVDWSAFDAALIGSTWDYQDNLEAFMARLENIEAQTALFNSSATVRWNSRKTYLRELESIGVNTVPTLWLDAPGERDIRQAFDRLGNDDLVFKRQVGANAEGQYRLHRGDPIPPMPEPMMAQPFLPSIQSEGEMSLIFIDGAFSHALIKSAAAGDYRIQSSYGGSERGHDADQKDRAAAAAIVEALDETPLYARVDMARGDDGRMLLMELELIEPFLYPLQGPELGARLYAGLENRLA
ncbi:MAG: ATP-grasp domain-containing protein [Parasphingopyxis sp.]